MKLTVLIVIVNIVLFSSCSHKTDVVKEKQALIEADKSFSSLSEKTGIHKAFILYIDSSCILLRRNLKPIVGSNAIVAQFKKGDDSQYSMIWKPISSEVAASGDMGFTYGIYELSFKKGNKALQKGTYVSIWKKTTNGKWKLWLDTGNEGIGE
jgi:ketosteroid isomerase-like protein